MFMKNYHEIWIAFQWDNYYLNVHKSGEKNYKKVLKANNEQHFSTVKYLENGIIIAMSYAYPGSISKDYYATNFERKDNYLNILHKNILL